MGMMYLQFLKMHLENSVGFQFWTLVHTISFC